MKLRVLSFNVNGLRTLCNVHSGLEPLLDSLQADIICFQEHKLRRDELDPSIALAPGWESFFAFNRTGNCKGYSGVCTFVRRSIGIPLDAEEGMTGFLALDRSIPKSKAPSHLGPAWEEYPADVLESIESEGRCLITDHGAFLLFNIYGPAITSDSEEKAEERIAYKRAFFTALEVRLRQALDAGRRVLLLGDLNIQPAPEDSRDPTYRDERFFTQFWSRAWLRSLVGSQERSGPFRDTFRLFHPTRAQAFTCWSTASGARVHNWGSRIDLLLAADGRDLSGQAVSSWVVGGDIMPDVQGSDHCPAFCDLELQGDLPSASSIPRASARFLFDSGKATQAKLTSFFGRRPEDSAGAVSNSAAAGPSCSAAETGSEANGAGRQTSSQSKQAAGGVLQVEASSSNGAAASGTILQAQKHCFPPAPSLGLKPASTSSNRSKGPNAGTKRPVAQQLSMRAFLPPKPPPLQQPPPAAALLAGQHHPPEVQRSAVLQQEQLLDGCVRQGGAAGCERQGTGDDDDDNAENEPGSCRLGSADGPEAAGSQSSAGNAKAAGGASWSFGSTPRCRHNEPSVARTVKKKGPTRGREFYCCARPDGPKPQGRCDFFSWRFSQPGDAKKQKQS